MLRTLALALAVTSSIAACRTAAETQDATSAPPTESVAPRAALQERETSATEALAVPVPAAFGSQVMRVHFIDVGQGAATLIEFPGETVLVDTGGERWAPQQNKPPVFDSTKALTAYLDGFFADRPGLGKRLDLLVLTHPHADHTRGVHEVLKRYQPRNVVTNGQNHGSGIDGQDEAREYADERPDVGSWYVLAHKIDPATGFSNVIIDPVDGNGGVNPKIRALWGQVRDDQGWDSEDFADENNHSVVLRIDYGDASLLITGDLEEHPGPGPAAGIERLIAKYEEGHLLDVDVYELGHHGSHNGNTSKLVEAISPQIAVIAAGPPCERKGYSAWEHAHPRMETIDELLHAGSLHSRPPVNVKLFEKYQSLPVLKHLSKAIYCTGWDGTVVLEADQNGTWGVVKATGQKPCEPSN